ncbi:hypothetical protein AM598_09220 [Paenibacillus polymyxa]|nr:hypothetical protein AM598_09220 [Paenibacillus polymyxa]
MNPSAVKEGITYHNGKGEKRTVILIGNRVGKDGELYYKKEHDSGWYLMTLLGFARWAKGEVSGKESKSMKEVIKRDQYGYKIYPLLDGSEVLFAEEDKVLFHRDSPEDTAFITDPETVYEDLLGLIDSLQQQVYDQVQEIHMLNVANNIQKDTAVDWDKLVDRVTAERDALHDQIVERDRTIARQSAALETATDALNGILNGEWSETIDDQFLEVFTTRRINPSRIADEALFAIGRELEALGE